MTNQYQGAFLMRLDNLARLDIELLRDLTPLPLKKYRLTGHVSVAALSRARTSGQHNFLTRVRAHLIAFRLAGHGREWGERVLARIQSMVDEVWPVCELGPVDAVQLEAFADAIERQVAASKTLYATIRQLLLPHRVGA